MKSAERTTRTQRRRDSARALLQVLLDAGVEFIVCGGVAAEAHGLRKRINDLDVIYRRSPENFRRLVAALRPYRPRPRGSAPDFEAPWNVSVLRDGYSFIMSTTLGELDLIAELSAVGTWPSARKRAEPKIALGLKCECLNLDALIENVEASGRPKDLRLGQRLRGLKKRKA